MIQDTEQFIDVSLFEGDETEMSLNISVVCIPDPKPNTLAPLISEFDALEFYGV